MALLRVSVKPRSRANALVALDEAGLLTVSVTAAPADGQANKAVEHTIAKTLGVPKTCVRVARGATARVKTVEIAALSDEELRIRLAQIFA